MRNSSVSHGVKKNASAQESKVETRREEKSQKSGVVEYGGREGERKQRGAGAQVHNGC